MIDPRDGRKAAVIWHSEQRLPRGLLPLARQLGYSEAELSNHTVGVLTTDLTVGDDVFLRGALVIPDEEGVPAALYGQPLLRHISERGSLETVGSAPANATPSGATM